MTDEGRPQVATNGNTPEESLLAGFFRPEDLARVYDPLPIEVLLISPGREILWHNRALEQRLGKDAARRPLLCYEIMHGDGETAGQCLAAQLEHGSGKHLPLATRDDVGRHITLIPLWNGQEGQDLAGYICLYVPKVQPPGRPVLPSGEEMRALASPTVDAIILMDLEGRITYWNPTAERMFGYSAADCLGRSLYELVMPPELQEVQQRAFAEFSHSGRSQLQDKLLELDVRHQDGTLFPVEFAFSLLNVGDAPRVLGFVRDISYRKQREQEEMRLRCKLQQAQKLESLGVLAGGIAHDFNNLLMGVLGYADLALLQLPLESPAREYLRQIEIAARRAAELTSQMLAYSGRARFMVEAVNLSRLVEEIVHLLKTVVSKNAVLKLSLTRELPPVEVDTSQVRQVVMNLVTNASDSIEDKSGVITITTGVMEADHEYLSETYLDDDLPPGFYAYLEVSDTGCGMDRETRACLFDPFFTTKFTGRGLGMAAVLGIVRGHRGAIKVYSEPGHGTTVKVLFPCSAPPEAGQHKAAACGPSPHQGLILVVDDEETVRAVSKMMLEHAGHRVLTAEDGRDGLQRFREQPDEIDMVLLDMTMPHLNGEECYREMRRIRPDVRVLLTSGYNEQEAIARFAGKGLAGFVQKPFSMGELLGAVDRVLGGSDAEDK
ncbi:MAG: hypothetical protein BWK76_14935 [Desulfobulbaceae bacterium A2]|nr:MAG: hypothetical protein BWK76_14935 [Desulfobulbaceae bacterium A2]